MIFFRYHPPMNNLWLIKIGEISLKKGNRAYFERMLKENIHKKVQRYTKETGLTAKVSSRRGRYYLETGIPEDEVIRILESTPGIVGFSRAYKVKKTLEDLAEISISIASECLSAGIGGRFKFEVRRTDKSLPLDSYGYARELGGLLLEALPELTVDVRNPDFIIKVELREAGYVYQMQKKGTGGLPVGTAGRGVLLLSGGIDSPVAGYLMSKRGLKLTAVHFHTPPYTSPEAHDKVVRLAALIAPWCQGLTLYSVPFTECQIKINQSVHPSTTTLHTRSCMMQIAEQIAKQRRSAALVTGESLGQVASQTLESLAFTNGSVPMPVFRPLIGMDKEEIVVLARKIGTFETAIEPFEDCCTLFSPEKPVTRPDVMAERLVYEGIEGLDNLIEKAAEEAVIYKFDELGKAVKD
ncbi:MAG: tRNA 4-thiouridine(8) synthase ThiI [Spirochaetes bacterium]|nr:MAG: tRNA 4-thiouridine(8) synthase ThiI [Spirochaetota bacterium]